MASLAGPVLDAGCGPGVVTAALHDLGIDAFGIDLSPRMIAIARRDHPQVSFAVDSMADLHLQDATVGAVLAFYSLIHVPDDEVPRVLAQFRRVTRPGGVVIARHHPVLP